MCDETFSETFNETFNFDQQSLQGSIEAETFGLACQFTVMLKQMQENYFQKHF